MFTCIFCIHSHFHVTSPCIHTAALEVLCVEIEAAYMKDGRAFFGEDFGGTDSKL